MDKKLKLLQEKLNNAVGIAALSCPEGVSVDFWDMAINDLFEANNLINYICRKRFRVYFYDNKLCILWAKDAHEAKELAYKEYDKSAIRTVTTF